VELLRHYSSYAHLTKPLVRLLQAVQSTGSFNDQPVTLNTCSNSTMPVRQRQRRLEPSKVTELITNYQAGAQVKDLATQFNVERRTVSAILRRYGIPPRPRGLNQQQVEEAAQMYGEDWSLARIGSKLGVSAETVRKRLQERGVVMREAWERG
jgi:hypothetical protein